MGKVYWFNLSIVYFCSDESNTESDFELDDGFVKFSESVSPIKRYMISVVCTAIIISIMYCL